MKHLIRLTLLVFMIAFWGNKGYGQKQPDMNTMKLAKQEQDSISQIFSYQKSIYYYDTGFVIFSQPHYMCYFVSSNAVSLESCIKENEYSRYNYIYNDTFKKIMLEDILPSYIKTIKTCEIYYSGSLFQRSLYYFKARIKLKLPLHDLAYVSIEDYKLTKHYLLMDDKRMFLYPIFKSSGSILDCVSFEPME